MQRGMAESLQAKFHYASWFEAGSKLVRAEIWPIIQLASSELARAGLRLNSITLFGSKLVRSWFEAGSRPASNQLV